MASIPTSPPLQIPPDPLAVIRDSLETLSDLYEYNHWIYSLLRPHLGQRVLEIGCGTGTLTRFLAMSARHVTDVEPVEAFVRQFQARLGHMKHVHVHQALLQELQEPGHPRAAFDTVVSCNVLEHIADDVEALAIMRRQLRPGGRVVVFVPAGRWAFGRLDQELGHYRRYTLRTLRRAMEAAGLEWLTGRYSNLIGAVGWWWNSAVLRQRAIPPRQAALFNRLVPLISALERVLPLPMGQSVLGVGRRPPADGLQMPGLQPLQERRAA